MAEKKSDDVSVVGRGAKIDGTLTSAGSLEIHGRLTGAITVEGEVSVAPGSEVRADINAHTISLAGRVKGNLTAPGAVVLPAQSQVEGDVRAQNVTVHGAVTGDVVAEQGVGWRPGARRRRHHVPHARDRRGRVLRGPLEHVGAALAAPVPTR